MREWRSEGVGNYGIMELWNYGIAGLGKWRSGELWNYGIVELWNSGIGEVEEWGEWERGKKLIMLTKRALPPQMPQPFSCGK